MSTTSLQQPFIFTNKSISNMSRSNDAGHFFQTTYALETTTRKTAKSKNTHGSPIKLPSKLLAIHPDPQHEGAVYIAEAAGEIKRVVLEVGEQRSSIRRNSRIYRSVLTLPHRRVRSSASPPQPRRR